MGIVTSILDSIDTSISNVGARFFEATATALGPVVTLLVTILVIGIGINIAFGAASLSLRDSLQLLWRVVLVYVFALSWANFGVIYHALSEGSGNLAMGFFEVASQGGAAPTPSAAMDDFARNMTETANAVSRAQGSIQRGVIGAISYFVLALMMAGYVLVVGFAKIMIAFLLGVAPLAMAGTIFDKTRNLFEAWITSFVGYLMYPIAAAAIIASVVKVGEAQFPAGDDITNLGSILGFFVVVFVGIFALKAIPQAASHLTGQFHLASISPQPIRGLAHPLAGPLASRARATGSGLLSGGQTPRRAQELRDRTWAERGGRLAEKIRAASILR
ncbi:type IV secretion system protein [Paracoccus sp. CPCC 101403]|uniref:Type IV secretion system protein n=1 Tax=Paracoccus broussonetiae TaxID=3075834 RepID=A0ABU3EKC3_9RHOB|nr:type IV secretion system protein [Paracoccus sp. CPCC 101403]MDT1064691.1 type IV secretion system protein [Paracoccus sp. CPCC 101403]